MKEMAITNLELTAEQMRRLSGKFERARKAAENGQKGVIISQINNPEDLEGLCLAQTRFVQNRIAQQLVDILQKHICPFCKGKGMYSCPEATSVDISSDGWFECDRCDGTGLIEVI